jgi:L,D-transpeptidase catalytic domain
MRVALLGLAVAAVSATAAPARAQVRPPGLPDPIGNEQLSDELTITRFASALFETKIRSFHDGTSKPVGRLRFVTEDGYPEVYLVLRGHVDHKGNTWVQIRVPRRPNGTKGWVPLDDLDELQLVRTRLVVNRKALRATLYLSGRPIWTSRVGIGAPGTHTPAGHFYIRERIRNLRGGGLYGPWAFGTSAYSKLSDWPGGGVVGIHGTNQPQLIPGRPSHGCIRVPNDKVRELAALMPIGTPVRIF